MSTDPAQGDPVNWKLTQKIIDEPVIDEWEITTRLGRISGLDLLFEMMAERGDTKGVTKIKDGVYFVRHHDGWLSN